MRLLAEEFLDVRDAVQVKYEMVRRVEAEGMSVTETTGRVWVFAAVVL